MWCAIRCRGVLLDTSGNPIFALLQVSETRLHNLVRALFSACDLMKSFGRASLEKIASLPQAGADLPIAGAIFSLPLVGLVGSLEMLELLWSRV